jgi:hypothetical protein
MDGNVPDNALMPDHDREPLPRCRCGHPIDPEFGCPCLGDRKPCPCTTEPSRSERSAP